MEENVKNEPTVEEVKKEVKAEGEKKKEKKSKKNEELEKLKEELEKNKDLLARTAAEFDNYKKRTARERATIAEYAKAEQIKVLLPVFDNIDRAGEFNPESADYIKGIELIVKQFASLAEKLSLVEVAKVGDTFDPSLHEAVMHIEDEALGENVIAEVLQKGYKIGDTVIRPAMVKVAN